MARKNSQEFKLWYAISLATQLGFLIAVPLTGFMLLGFWADKIFSISPLLLILGTFMGMAITIYEVYNFLLPLLEKDDDSD